MKQLILFFLMLGATYALQAQTVTTIDFTNPATPTYGTNAMMNVGGVMMLKPGDANGDKQVKYTGSSNDRNAVLAVVGLISPSNIISGYYQADVNMDGQVKYTGAGNDSNVVLGAVGLLTPSVILLEQIP